jgi:hypothetical protein
MQRPTGGPSGGRKGRGADMTITYQRHSNLLRATGRSAVAATAYVMRSSMRDDRTGVLHTYTRGRGLDTDPDGSGVVGWKGSTSDLANAMEAAEKRKDARTARLFVVALPNELSPAEQRGLLLDYAQALHAIDQAPVIFARHQDNNGNVHAHYIKSTRPSNDGLTLSANKARMWDAKKTKDVPADQTGEATCARARTAWITLGNAALVKAGYPPSLTYENPPDVVPQRHMGPAAAALESKGVQTEVGDYNRLVRARNSAAAALKSAQEVEAAAIVAPPPAPPLAPVRKALERPATATPPMPSGIAVRGSDSKPPLEDVGDLWPTILGKYHRNPEDRAKAIFPTMQVQVGAHGEEAVRSMLIETAPGTNLRNNWLVWRQVAARAKALTRRGAEVWDRLTRPPPELLPLPPSPVRPFSPHSHDSRDGP